MSYKINCLIEPHYPLKKPLIASAVTKTLETVKVKAKTEVSISVIGDRKMRRLNREYRGIDKPTDVLAFPYLLDSGKLKEFISPPSKYLNLGDVVISYPQLINRAAKEDTLIDDMAEMLVVHGCLHLLGYEHQKDKETSEMESLEDQILSSIQN